MGHACGLSSFEERCITDDQEHKKFSFDKTGSCSLQSSGSDFSVRTGSTQPGTQQLHDSFCDSIFWNNSLIPGNVVPPYDSQQSILSSQPLQQDLLSQPGHRVPQITKKPSLQKPPPPVPHRPVIQSTPIAATDELSNELHLSQQPQESTSNKKLQALFDDGKNEHQSEALIRKSERAMCQPPMLPVRIAPSLRLAISTNVAEQSFETQPKVIPKPDKGCLDIIPPPTSSQDHLPQLQPKLVPRDLRPQLPPKPEQYYFDIIASLASPQEHHPPHLLPRSTQEHHPPQLPPKPTQRNISPQLQPEPEHGYLALLPPPASAQEHLPPQLPHHSARNPQQQPPSIPPKTPSPLTSSSEDETTSHNAPLMPPALQPYRHDHQLPNQVYRQPHWILHRHNLIGIIIFSFLLSLASISLLALILINPFSYRWQERTFTEGIYKTCVKCVYLMNDITDTNKDLLMLFNEPRKGEMFCCAQTSSQMSALLKLIVKQQGYKPSDKSNTDESHLLTPFAHRVLIDNISQHQSKAVTSDRSLVNVNQDEQFRHNNRSIGVTKNGLVIGSVDGTIFTQTFITRSIAAR
uniref:Uncharacterized protein n=1 Tax=Arion vulgaris TaxID=1028688 RepID=A0A0B7B3Z0_9EUPU